MPPRDLLERTRLFALAVLAFSRKAPQTKEAQEAIDAALLQEARELAAILAAADRTARKNTARIKAVPRS